MEYKYVPITKYQYVILVGFLLALKNEMPYFRAFPGFVDYSSSSRATTCSITSFANLQDIVNILSGIERNSYIIRVFLSCSYPWDKNNLV